MPFIEMTSRKLPWYNVQDYGAQGDGVANDRMAIQGALDACRIAGGGTVYAPRPSVAYRVAPVAHPNDGTKQVGLVVGANTRLIGDGIAATIIQLAANSPNQAALLMNYAVTSPGSDENITLVDLKLDGNAANQNSGVVDAQFGTWFLWMRGLKMERVQSTNFFGTTSGGVGPHGQQGEGFHLWAELSTDISFVDCLCVGSGAQSATGFQVDACNNIQYVDCVARGFQIAHGFAHNNVAHIGYVNCASYGNTGYGFNSEISRDVAYANCEGGIHTTNNATYPYAAPQTSVGNSGGGFLLNNPTGAVTLHGCHGLANGTAGVKVINTIGNPAGSGGHILISGGDYSYNGVYGIEDDTTVGWLMIEGHPLMQFNGTAKVNANGVACDPEGALPAVGVPATTVALANPFPFSCTVYISGGTVTAIAVNGATTGLTAGSIRVPANGSITLTYSAAPAWKWVAD